MHCKAVLTLLGGILIHLTLGTLYTSSNLATYVISYLHVVKKQKSIDSSLSAWIFALQTLGQAFCMVLGGTLQRAIGIRWTLTVGCSLLTLSTICGYWTVNNYYVLCLTYGVIFGMGVGIAYSAPMTAAMKWLPHHRGLANGLIVFGFGFGSLIFNFVETFIINPHNKPEVIDPTGVTDEKFFPAEVVEHMPRVFIILGCCYALMQLVGILFISEPTEEELKEINKEETAQPLLDKEAQPEAQPEVKPEVKPVEGLDSCSTLKRGKFWQIWNTLLCISMVNVFVSSFYKFFGSTFIENDFFLVLVGSISSICNGVCRPFWGWINDRIGYKKTMSIMLSIFTVFISTFCLTKVGGEWMFMLWVCCMYFCIGGAYALLPTYTDECFGPAYFGANYGMVFTSVIISSLISAFFVTIMIKKIGVAGITISLGVVVLIGLLITAIPKNWTYKDIAKEEVKEEKSNLCVCYKHDILQWMILL